MSEDGDSLDIPVPTPALFKQVEDDEPGVEPELDSVLKCSEGSIKQLTKPAYLTDRESNLEPFQKFMQHVERLDSISQIKYNALIIMSFRGGIHAEAFYTRLLENKCSIVGVNCVEPDVCTALAMRSNTRSRFSVGPKFDSKYYIICEALLSGIFPMGNVGKVGCFRGSSLRATHVCTRARFSLGAELESKIDHIYVLKSIQGKRKEYYNGLVYSGCKEWMQTGTNYKVNFKVDTSPPEYTVDDLKNEWATMEKGEIECVILSCEEKKNRKHPLSDKEYLIATMGRKVHSHLSATSSIPTSLFYADSEKLLELNQFINVDSVTYKTFNPITGALIEFPMREFYSEKYYAVYTGVLMGHSSLGKTEYKKSEHAAIANDIWTYQNERPFFLKFESIDSMREAQTNGLLKSGVGFIMDDVELQKLKDSRKGCPKEEVKTIVEVQQATTIAARFRDIKLDENQPRSFTTNALTPHEWHNSIPVDVFETSDAVRVKYDTHVKAIFKRTCFALVTQPLISEEMREAHDAKRRRRIV